MAIAPVNTGDIIQASTINGLVNGSIWLSLETGVVNAYKVTYGGLTPNFNTITGLTNGLMINFVASIANTGPATLQVVGAGGALIGSPVPITKFGSAALAPRDIKANQAICVIYNLAQARFEMVTPTTVPGIRGVQVLTTNTMAVAAAPVVNPAWTSALQLDTYWTSPSNAIVVPAGLAGSYFVTATVQFPAFNGVAAWASLGINVNGTASPFMFQVAQMPANVNAPVTLTVTGALNLAVGNSLTFSIAGSRIGQTTVAANTTMQAFLLGVPGL